MQMELTPDQQQRLAALLNQPPEVFDAIIEKAQAEHPEWERIWLQHPTKKRRTIQGELPLLAKATGQSRWDEMHAEGWRPATEDVMEQWRAISEIPGDVAAVEATRQTKASSVAAVQQFYAKLDVPADQIPAEFRPASMVAELSEARQTIAELRAQLEAQDTEAKPKTTRKAG